MTIRMEVTQQIRHGAAILTIHRPQAKNAINRAVVEQLSAGIQDACADSSVRAIVLTGAGKDVFVAGGDLKEFQELNGDERGAQHILDLGVGLSCIETSDLPIIAAVQGEVLGGGCELLVMCDLVVIEQHAGIQFKHAKMGLTPAWGGTTRLLERVGSIGATDLLLTARRIDAAEALNLGLVNRIVPSGEALDGALELVRQIAQHSRTSVTALKRSLLRSRLARRGPALSEEREVFRQAWSAPSARQAMEEFRQRHTKA